MLRMLVFGLVLVACDNEGGGNPPQDGTSSDDGPPMSDGSMSDGSMNVDAAIGPGAVCGATTCMLGQEVCCNSVNPVCTATGMCPSQAFACDGPEDCPGMLCCFQGTGGSRCQTLCNEIACHADNDCPSATLKCCPKALSPNYRVCRTQC